MDSWTFNKIAGAVLATALAVLGLQNLGAALFHTTEVAEDKAGFKIEVAGSEQPAAAEPAAPAASLGTLLAAADKDKGAVEAKACAACHDFTSGGPNKVGPNLYDVVGRSIGTAAGFGYSDVLKGKSAEPWSYESLNAYIADPKGFAPGNKMAYGGLKSDKKRADLIAYLASLSAAPKPFPAP